MHKHTKCEFVFLCCTCAQPHMHTLIEASHLFLLLNYSEPSFPPYITNTAAKMFSALHSLQYWWYLDLFRQTYAAPSLKHLHYSSFLEPWKKLWTWCTADIIHRHAEITGSWLWVLWNKKCLLEAAEKYWFIITKEFDVIDVKLCFPHLNLWM